MGHCCFAGCRPRSCGCCERAILHYDGCRDRACTGDPDCTSGRHVHGCYADAIGLCDHPEEHDLWAASNAKGAPPASSSG